MTEPPPRWAPTGYLDSASGLPLCPQAERTLVAATRASWADPTRRHGYGRRSNQVLELARAQMAAVLGCRPPEVHFVGSGASALATAIAAACAGQPRKPRVVLSAVERMAAFRAVDTLPAAVERRVIAVDGAGRVDQGAAVACVEGAAAVVVQSANIEIGTIQPFEAIAEAASAVGATAVLDATASLGWLDPPAGWGILVADAALWGGPTGVGVLAIREGIRVRQPWPVGEPEGGYLLSPVAVPAIAAAAEALTAFRHDAVADRARVSDLAAHLRIRLPELIEDVSINGDPRACLPHIVNVSILYGDADRLVDDLDREGLSVHSGSACTSELDRPSHVLTASGVLTHGNLRISLAPGVSSADIGRLLDVLPQLVHRMRRDLGVHHA